VTRSKRKLNLFDEIRAKKDFLETEPKGLDSALKSHEQAKKLLSAWGK
jgi:hypothetical protein